MTDTTLKMEDKDRAGTVEKYRKGYAELDIRQRLLAGTRGGRIFALKCFSRFLNSEESRF